MQKLLIAISVVMAVVGTSAFAADMPLEEPPPAPVPVFSWTGFYAGLNAGGAWGTSHISFNPTGPAWTSPSLIPGTAQFFAAQGSPTLRSSGFTGGGQAGYNYQVGNYILGVEGDINYVHLKMSRTSPMLSFPVGSSPLFFNESVSTSWVATVRPRVGVTVNRLMIYGTGGLAVGNQNFSESFNLTVAGFPPAAGTTNQTKVGWTAGAGFEYAFTYNLSAKLEYLYLDLGSVGFTTLFPPPGNPGVSQNVSSRLTENMVRAGLNYRFAW